MTIWFQIVLIFVSIMTCAFILRSIRKSQVQINDAIFWVFFSLILLVFSIFPGLASNCKCIRNCISSQFYLFICHFLIAHQSIPTHS